MPSYYERRPTPPPVNEALFDGNDPPRPWYWVDVGGGFILDFGKHQGQKIHATSLTYLRFVEDKCPYKTQFCSAFAKYYAGLEHMTETDWDQFIVPFGKKHHGKTIRQCRDKPWLLWARSKQILTDKHPLFFRAVHQWLAHPRHYEITRDIGESTLRASDYEEDLGGYVNGDEDEADDMLPEEPTESDLDFIAKSDEDADVDEEDDLLKRLDEDAEKITEQLKAASPSKTKNSLPKAAKFPSKGLRASFKATKPFQPPKSSPKKFKNATQRKKQTTPDSFIIEDASDGEASYADTEESGPPVMTRRLTRSRAKANLSAEADLTEENEDEDEDADDENNAIASSLRNLPSSTSVSASTSRNVHMAADEASSDNELPKSPCHSRRTRKIAMSEPSEDEEMPMPSTPAKEVPTRDTTEESEDLLVKPPKSCRVRKQIILASDDDEGSESSSPAPRLPVRRNRLFVTQRMKPKGRKKPNNQSHARAAHHASPLRRRRSSSDERVTFQRSAKRRRVVTE